MLQDYNYVLLQDHQKNIYLVFVMLYKTNQSLQKNMLTTFHTYFTHKCCVLNAQTQGIPHHVYEAGQTIGRGFESLGRSLIMR